MDISLLQIWEGWVEGVLNAYMRRHHFLLKYTHCLNKRHDACCSFCMSKISLHRTNVQNLVMCAATIMAGWRKDIAYGCDLSCVTRLRAGAMHLGVADFKRVHSGSGDDLSIQERLGTCMRM